MQLAPRDAPEAGAAAGDGRAHRQTAAPPAGRGGGRRTAGAAAHAEPAQSVRRDLLVAEDGVQAEARGQRGERAAPERRAGGAERSQRRGGEFEWAGQRRGPAGGRSWRRAGGWTNAAGVGQFAAEFAEHVGTY